MKKPIKLDAQGMKLKTLSVKKKVSKTSSAIKTFRVGCTFHCMVDVYARTEEEAKDIISTMSTEDLTLTSEFDIDYCDEV